MKKLWSLVCMMVLFSCSTPSNVVSENLMPLERLNFSNKEINVQGVQLACLMRTGVSRVYYFGEGKAYEILGSWGEEGRSNFILNLEYKPIAENEERILMGRENGLFCNGFTANVCTVRNTEYEYGTCEVFDAPDTVKEFLAPFRDKKF
jgi:hypothetical protein